MVSLIFLILLAFLTGYYVRFLRNVTRGLRQIQRAGSSISTPFVSVIVAARNEEKNIEACLNSFLQQTYSRQQFEVIVVDDGSTDSTSKIVKGIASQTKNVRLVSVPHDSEGGGGGKPEAIVEGIKKSNGEIILTTDADCIVPKEWIHKIVTYFEPTVAFVVGPVVEESAPSFFSNMQRLELLGLITTAAGLIGIRRPIICNGANIAYRKSAFAAVNGYEGSSSSCDDETLMQRIAHRKIGDIRFATNPDVIVKTKSNNSWRSFWLQRIRWAAKRGRYEDRSILSALIFLYFFFFMLLASVIFSFFVPMLWIGVCVCFFCKLVVDYSALRHGGRLFEQKIQLFPFIVAEILHAPYIVLAAAIGQSTSFEWKGRTIKG